MLTPEEAKTRLEQIRQPAWVKERVALAKKLPGGPRSIADKLAGHKRSLVPFFGGDKQHQAALQAVTELSASERQSLFAALWPKMVPAIEQAWQLIGCGVYEASWAGRSFRAPSAPGVYARARLNWLFMLAALTEEYNVDAPWLAAWGPHLAGAHILDQTVGYLLAGAIDAGGPEADEVLATLIASARGEHEVGVMGEHVIRALITCARPEAWAEVERLLLAAQREEGLRQAILERVDEAHPACFRRILRVILDHGLARFSATIRAADVWFGFAYEALAQREVEQAIARTLTFLEDEAAREAALAGDEATDFHLALWSLASNDAMAAIARAQAYLADPLVEKRFVAARLLQAAGLNQANRALIRALSDDDLRVAVVAAQALMHDTEEVDQTDLFERLAALVPRLPAKSTTLPALVYPWWQVAAQSSCAVYPLIGCRGKRPVEQLLPLVPHFDPGMRRHLLDAVKKGELSRPKVRAFVLDLLGDTSSDVRSRALERLKDVRIEPAEAAQVEGLLSRKATDLRRAGLQLLLNQADADALASAQRLTGAKDGLQRLAGLELLRELAVAEREAPACRKLAVAYREGHATLTADEQAHLEQLTGAEQVVYGPENGFGLYDPSALTPGVAPRPVLSTLVTPAARALLGGLTDQIAAQAETMVTFEGWDGTQTEPLANAYPSQPEPSELPAAERTPDKLPLMEVWLAWYETRPADLRDADGLELVRAWWAASASEARAWANGPSWAWFKPWSEEVLGGPRGKLGEPDRWLGPILNWLMLFAPPPAEAAARWLVAAGETALAAVPPEARRAPRGLWGWEGAPIRILARPLGEPCTRHRRLWPDAWSAELRRHWYQLMVWLGQPVTDPNAKRSTAQLAGKVGKLMAQMIASVTADVGEVGEATRARPEFEDAVATFDVGALSESDLLDYLLGTEQGAHPLPWLATCTARRVPPYLAASPGLPALVQRACERLLTIELARGDRPTAATPFVTLIHSIHGVDWLVRILASLGKDGFRRAAWGDESKGGVLSGVLRVCFPAESDTLPAAAERIRAAKLPEQLLCDAALLAPQWAPHLGAALGWEGFASGVWWLYAHTKDSRWEMDDDIREAWSAKVTEHTPLTSQDLLDGAVDVAWFASMYATLGEARFKRLYDAAKFGSSGTGHARARLFADAMLGRATSDDLRARIADKRHQDSLRALGLAPLPEGDLGEAEVLSRYEVIAEFQRTARQFGAQRRESEQRAAAIALDNLARTAGYPDPLRLQWAMETRAVADLKAGPVTVTVGETTVALSISADGQPELTASKGGKALKSVPSAIGKDPAVAELRARKTSLDRAASRMKAALEQSMCRADRFTGRELSDLLEHPLLAPSLAGLLWLGEGIAGYPAEGGQALRDHAGTLQALGRDEPLRLAHPVDLLAGGEWHLWQHEAFAAARVQPFKQVFRELYTLTQTERDEPGGTRRYAGHQVQPRQALALLGQRGWVHDPESGLRRTWHEAGLSAWIEFAESFWTPAEVEGLTLESVHFARRGEWQPVPLGEVPPLLFSEAMRDLDLVVSVAHRGGVDPEATASTIELRTMLLRETCALMGLDNVRIDDRHVFIDGHFGRYSVHLGSAVAHRQPGGMLFIVPVHSQHRGRLFLPFADDDPKTAEVLSKVLLLARDQEIRDPSILAAIRG